MSPKKVLCIDDYQEDCELLTHYLDQAEYAVISVSSAKEAIAKAREETFDLYILDVRLPDGSGFDLARSLRSFDPVTPIVFHSASAMSWQVEEGLKIAEAYITKPSEPDTLRATIRQLTS